MSTEWAGKGALVTGGAGAGVACVRTTAIDKTPKCSTVASTTDETSMPLARS
ncbi:hypothetical protein ACWDUN_20315 [Mycobacterium sp. NPDC003323]|uniref:hypothetical protein n=1 Tax=Mycolicibacterium neoaurum TaxID=1795 RepID=UPI001BCE5D8C|nr:hypothetical protein [Mycolicibacterium neoaurum]QVI27346.1 hypothetical protein MN2019_24610 [Mycolicibacterium neoaurum]